MNIYVGNLSDDVSEENLRQAFESFFDLILKAFSRILKAVQITNS